MDKATKNTLSIISRAYRRLTFIELMIVLVIILAAIAISLLGLHVARSLNSAELDVLKAAITLRIWENGNPTAAK